MDLLNPMKTYGIDWTLRKTFLIDPNLFCEYLILVGVFDHVEIIDYIYCYTCTVTTLMTSQSFGFFSYPICTLFSLYLWILTFSVENEGIKKGDFERLNS